MCLFGFCCRKFGVLVISQHLVDNCTNPLLVYFLMTSSSSLFDIMCAQKKINHNVWLKDVVVYLIQSFGEGVVYHGERLFP